MEPILARTERVSRSALPALGALFLSLLAVAVAMVAIELHAVLEHVDADVQHVDQLIQQVSRTSEALDGQASGILSSVDLAAQQAALFAVEQRTQLQRTSGDSDKTVKALRIVIDRAGLLMKHADEEIAVNSGQAQITVAKLGESADGLTRLADTFDTRLRDPSLPQLLEHLDAIAGSLQVVSANSALMSSDMQLAVHRLAQPPTKFHQFLSASWTAAKFGSLFVP